MSPEGPQRQPVSLTSEWGFGRLVPLALVEVPCPFCWLSSSTDLSSHDSVCTCCHSLGVSSDRQQLFIRLKYVLL